MVRLDDVTLICQMILETAAGSPRRRRLYKILELIANDLWSIRASVRQLNNALRRAGWTDHRWTEIVDEKGRPYAVRLATA